MENEVNLVQYIKVVLKSKKLIFVLTVLSAIGAGIISFSAPTIYKTEALVMVGGDGLKLLEEPASIVEKINSGTYAGQPATATFLEPSMIKIKVEATDPDSGEKSIGEITNAILADHGGRINYEKVTIEKKIEKLQKDRDFFMARAQQIIDIQWEIYRLQNQKESLVPSQIIKTSATTSERKTNLPFNLISGILLGFFAGLFLSFPIEWWQKNKSEF